MQFLYKCSFYNYGGFNDLSYTKYSFSSFQLTNKMFPVFFIFTLLDKREEKIDGNKHYYNYVCC